MRQVQTLTDWRAAADDIRSSGRRVGLVPTMGALHAGHASLIDAAVAHGDVPLVTIFVNPRQFNDPADFAAYPSTLTNDLALAREHGAAVVVTPSVEAMWPAGVVTTVSVAGPALPLEGMDRPGHFDGVASVVAKLFAVTGPCRAYFGEKDFQQLAVIRSLVRDLGFPVALVSCPTIRDEHGLALSSRNARLSPAGRVTARGFSAALRAARDLGPAPARDLRRLLLRTMMTAGIDVRYAEVVHPETLAPVAPQTSGRARALVAGFVDGVRLIDNAEVVCLADEEV
jgi:pantoate--beta-alanine ligase